MRERERERERDFVCDVRFPFLGEIILGKKGGGRKNKRKRIIYFTHLLVSVNSPI
jgi:hypothetical protein